MEPIEVEPLQLANKETKLKNTIIQHLQINTN